MDVVRQSYSSHEVIGGDVNSGADTTFTFTHVDGTGALTGVRAVIITTSGGTSPVITAAFDTAVAGTIGTDVVLQAGVPNFIPLRIISTVHLRSSVSGVKASILGLW
jgi:hypothetical protein